MRLNYNTVLLLGGGGGDDDDDDEAVCGSGGGGAGEEEEQQGKRRSASMVQGMAVLVPYRPQHVPRYHEWMRDPALLEATASEPLSLEEEYEMQSSWKDDDRKCTFIVLDRRAAAAAVAGLMNDKKNAAAVVRAKADTDTATAAAAVTDVGLVVATTVDGDDDDETFIDSTLDAMVGDVNLFLSEEEEDEEKEERLVGDEDGRGNSEEEEEQRKQHQRGEQYRQAEVDIMIAEPSARRKGIGTEATILMMLYGALNLRVRRYFCKINETNGASISLFGDGLEFVRCGYAECFRQYEYELKRSSPEEMVETLMTKLYCSYSSSLPRPATIRATDADADDTPALFYKN